jgi:hypothetical protein
MEQAASQIQDSRDLFLGAGFFFAGIGGDSIRLPRSCKDYLRQFEVNYAGNRKNPEDGFRLKQQAEARLLRNEEHLWAIEKSLSPESFSLPCEPVRGGMISYFFFGAHP